MKLNDLKDKRILILGFGKEGKDTLKFLKKLFPKKVIGIADQKEFSISNFQFSNIKWHLGKNYLKAIKNYDIIIKSPGIPIHLPEIEKAYQEGKITSQTEIFLENCPGKIIGIIGTKGKGTTSLLIYQILKQGGLKAHLVGNIGKPVLQLLFSATPEDIYVYELSSHQLYNLKRSPQIVVFLNIYPDHLDYYKNFKEYALAEANICRYQKKEDCLIYNSRDKIIREFAKKSKAKKIPILRKLGALYEYTNKFKEISTIKTVNPLSLAATVIVGEIFKISKEEIIQAFKNFKPLPHRLEYVGTFKGIKFYNDSASTIPEATISALNILGDSVETILLGGSEKKVSFKKLAKRILKSKIKNFIFFPTTGRKIWQALRLASLAQGKKLPNAFFVNNMKEAIKLAYQYTQKGKICLLSPASASFTLFEDYKERGNLFKKYVRLHKKS